MKHIKTYKIFESKVDDKIQLLKDLTIELQDVGLEVEVTKGFGSDRLQRFLAEYKNYIFMSVRDTNNKFNTDLFNTNIIDEFKETLKSYGMNPRGISSGDHWVVFKFDKWGVMTDSPILKESVHDTKEEIEVNVKD
jgi:hypothetical protein